MQHPNPTVVLILATNEVKSIPPGSYLAGLACGETVTLDPYGRWPDAEVYCIKCANYCHALDGVIPTLVDKLGSKSDS